ncbi:MAG: hypothetical protein ABR541_08520 [Candidatus Dormibacteria bacterium]
MFALRGLGVVLGALIVGSTFMSAVRNFIVPRAQAVLLSRLTFLLLRRLFAPFVRRSLPYEVRDRRLSIYAPLALMLVAGSWLLFTGAGFALILWALGDSPGNAATVSYSSLLTLGFARPAHPVGLPFTFIEAAFGLVLVALLIAFLPQIYSAFSRRETAVSLLDAVAGAPASPVTLLERHARIRGIDRLDPIWVRWREWFADVEESHTSIAALVFFRSPQPQRSWLVAAGCVLDAASLTLACFDLRPSPDAALCIRGGFVCLNQIADYFAIPHPADPQPDGEISVTREEFDQTWERLAATGAPMKANRDQAWKDFSGWRVNYDATLLGLASLTMAPEAMWSSDRGRGFSLPPVRRPRGRNLRR